MKAFNAMKAKIALASAALTLPMLAMADGDDPATVVVGKLNGLLTGVNSVGSAILGITLAVVGWFIFKRLANKA